MFAVLDPSGLDLVRLPGPHGPIIRCAGDLTAENLEPLRALLDLLGGVGHPTITLNLAACAYVDVEGLLTVLQQAAAMGRRGERLVVVSGFGSVRRMLGAVEIDSVIPVFPSEEAAERALSGCAPPEPYDRDWEIARAESIQWWRGILAALDSAPAAEVERLLTSMHGLCRRSEDAHHEAACGSDARCRECPLFHQLGGRRENLGCESLLHPILQSLLGRDRLRARVQVLRAIRLLEGMSMPPQPIT